MTDNKKILELFGPTFKIARWMIAFAVFLTVIISVLSVVDPVIYGRMIDIIVDSLTIKDTSHLISDIGLLLGLWAGIFGVNLVLGIISRYIFWTANNRMADDFGTRVSKVMLQWSQQRYSNIASGKAIKIFDDAWGGLFQFSSAIFSDIVPTMLSFVAVVIIGATIDWRLTIVSLTMLPVVITLGMFSWKKAKPRQRKVMEGWAGISRHLGESITNISTIQNFAQEAEREKGFAKRLKEVIKDQLKLNMFWAVFHAMGDSVTLIGRVIVFIIGIYFVAEGSLSLGVLVTFLGMLSYLLSPIQYAIANSLPRISQSWSQFKLLTDLIYQENDVVEAEDADELKDIDGDVELKNITFTYQDQNKPTIKGISLKIPAGTSCALVGPSGGGKTTLVKLINRGIDPTQGGVLIDGRDIRDYTLQSLRSGIGVVSQDTILFHDTVLNNVRFARPSATRNEVIEACERAEAHEFIQRLPKKYNSIVGERGVKLSGGERQRIALARIFLADTPILVLDESTSALDSETESKLQNTLKKVMKDRTTIVIAHRLSTIYLADQIVVLQSGKIIDRGTHNELMKKGGLYDKLWSLQAGGYID